MRDRFGNPERGTGNPLRSGKKKGPANGQEIVKVTILGVLGLLLQLTGVVWQHGYCLE